MPRIILSIPVAALLLLGLGACTASAYPAFNRSATERDALPSDFDDADTQEFDLASARFAGSYEDVDFYLIRKNEDICIVAAAGPRSIIGCSPAGAGGVSLSSPGLFTAQLVAEPARDGDGWIAISENIRVQPNP